MRGCRGQAQAADRRPARGRDGEEGLQGGAAHHCQVQGPAGHSQGKAQDGDLTTLRTPPGKGVNYIVEKNVRVWNKMAN